MNRVPGNSTVRRCLFPANDVTDQARVDNFANVLQESVAIEKIEKSKRWNFDFENEVPLDGPYEWFRRNEEGNWIGIKTEGNNNENKITENNDSLEKEKLCVAMQVVNEATPRSKKEDTERVPLFRKRRSTGDFVLSNDNGVRRKISFD